MICARCRPETKLFQMKIVSKETHIDNAKNASPPPRPIFLYASFPKDLSTVHPVHLACLEAKYLVPEGFTVLRIFFFNRALPGSSC